MGQLRIAIIGCGIAGQATAIFLARAGHCVTVFERFREPAPVGAGLLLQPSGLAVLQRLGLLDGAIAAGAAIAGIDGRTIAGHRVLDLSYSDLHPACRGLGIHRASLFYLLYGALRSEPIELVCDAHVSRLQQGDGFISVGGAEGRDFGRFDLAIVCDGAHSSLRRASGIRHRAPHYAWGCLWAAFRDHSGKFSGVLSQRFDSTRKMIGVLPVGRNPGASDDDRCVTLFWSLRRNEIPNWAQSDLAAWRDGLLRDWPALEDLLSSVADLPPMTGATYRDVIMPDWRIGRAIFIGDAAHGTSPQLGQGANLGLLDAYYLCRALRSDDAIASMDRFAAGRRPQVGYYRLASRWLTPFYQSDLPVLGALRDVVFGPMCRFAPSRNLMLSTLAGVRRSAVSVAPLDAGGLLRL